MVECPARGSDTVVHQHQALVQSVLRTNPTWDMSVSLPTFRKCLVIWYSSYRFVPNVPSHSLQCKDTLGAHGSDSLGYDHHSYPVGFFSHHSLFLVM